MEWYRKVLKHSEEGMNNQFFITNFCSKLDVGHVAGYLNLVFERPKSLRSQNACVCVRFAFAFSNAAF